MRDWKRNATNLDEDLEIASVNSRMNDSSPAAQLEDELERRRRKSLSNPTISDLASKR